MNGDVLDSRFRENDSLDRKGCKRGLWKDPGAGFFLIAP